MTEHKHEWILCVGNKTEEAWFRCGVIDCPERLEVDEVLARINATERLSAEDALAAESWMRKAAVEMQHYSAEERNKFLVAMSIVGGRVRAYANTLEGKL